MDNQQIVLMIVFEISRTEMNLTHLPMFDIRLQEAILLTLNVIFGAPGIRGADITFTQLIEGTYHPTQCCGKRMSASVPPGPSLHDLWSLVDASFGMRRLYIFPWLSVGY